MLRPAAEVQLLQHCAALVETLIERRRVFFINMFVLFYLQLRWFDPSQAGEMRRGRGGGFVSFSEGKETKDRAASFSFASSASPFPSFPRSLLLPLPPPALPPG